MDSHLPSPLRVLVTGANRGLGLGVTRSLALLGHHVVLACRSATLASEAISLLTESNSSISRSQLSFLELDVSSPASISSAVESLHGCCFDVLVNNAAIGSALGPESVIQTNYFGTATFTNRMHALLRSPGGRIVNVSSRATVVSGEKWASSIKLSFLEATSEEAIADACQKYIQACRQFEIDGDEAVLSCYGGFQPSNNYAVSKFALNGLTRLLHQRWSGEGIAVSCCCPGWVRTRMGCSVGEPPRSIDEGIVVIRWLVLHSNISEHGGKFFHHDADQLLEIVIPVKEEPETS